MGRDVAFFFVTSQQLKNGSRDRVIKVGDTRNFLHCLTTLSVPLGSQKVGSPHPTPCSASFLVIQGQI